MSKIEEVVPGEVLGPFIVQPEMKCHGVDGRTRIAVTDQTPRLNVLCWVLPEYAERIARTLSHEQD